MYVIACRCSNAFVEGRHCRLWLPSRVKGGLSKVPCHDEACIVNYTKMVTML